MSLSSFPERASPRHYPLREVVTWAILRMPQRDGLIIDTPENVSRSLVSEIIGRPLITAGTQLEKDLNRIVA